MNILLSDHFSECVEKHAYSTYDKFIKLNGGEILYTHEFEIIIFWYSFLTLFMMCELNYGVAEELKKLPPAEAAVKYYMNEDLYLFGKLHYLFYNMC